MRDVIRRGTLGLLALLLLGGGLAGLGWLGLWRAAGGEASPKPTSTVRPTASPATRATSRPTAAPPATAASRPAPSARPATPKPGEAARVTLQSGEVVEGQLVELGLLTVVVETGGKKRSFARTSVTRIEPPAPPPASARPPATFVIESPDPSTPTPPVNEAQILRLFNQYAATEALADRQALYIQVAETGRRTVGDWLVEHWPEVTAEGAPSEMLRALARSGAREALALLRERLGRERSFGPKLELIELYCQAAPYTNEVHQWRSALEGAVEDTERLTPDEKARVVFEQFPEELRWETDAPTWPAVARVLRLLTGRTGERPRGFPGVNR